MCSRLCGLPKKRLPLQSRLQAFEQNESSQGENLTGEAGDKKRIIAEAAGKVQFFGFIGKAVGI
jgi:hypothetical protein